MSEVDISFDLEVRNSQEEEKHDKTSPAALEIPTKSEVGSLIQKLLKQDLEGMDDDTAPTYERTIDDTYKLLNSDYILPTLYFKQKNQKAKNSEERIQGLSQYASIYFNRLEALKHCIKVRSFEKFSKDFYFFDHILDIQPFRRTIIVGTIYKEMKKKP